LQLTWRQTKRSTKKNGGTQKAMTLLQLCSVGASTKVFPGATQKLQTHRGGGGACEKKGGLGLGSGFQLEDTMAAVSVADLDE